MTPRFICPHCHSPLDPLTMDAASTRGAQLRICPDCDEPIVLALNPVPAARNAPPFAQLAENATR